MEIGEPALRRLVLPKRCETKPKDLFARIRMKQ